jgi:hypothetical protein
LVYFNNVGMFIVRSNMGLGESAEMSFICNACLLRL